MPASLPHETQQRTQSVAAQQSGIWYIDDLLVYIAGFLPPAPPSETAYWRGRRDAIAHLHARLKETQSCAHK